MENRLKLSQREGVSRGQNEEDDVGMRDPLTENARLCLCPWIL